jgi:ankyrin repeat protein
MKTHLRELNYLEEFTEVEIDAQITPLILAAHLGRVEITKILMENESLDVDKGSNDLQLTPLSVACAAGNFEVIEILLNNGANVNKADTLSRPPLYFCFIRLQEDSNVFENQLICMKMARLMLQGGADPNFVVNKEKGRTLLMEYCGITVDMSNKEKETNLKVIKFLLEHGADAGVKSQKGKTAHDYANKHPFKKDVQAILKSTKQIHYYKNSRRVEPIPIIGIKKYKIFSMEGNGKADCCNIFGCCKEAKKK